MNILFLGSDDLFVRVSNQGIGQSWVLHRAKDLDHLLDYEGTHRFQAAVIGLCLDIRAARNATKRAKTALRIPVVIGLASQDLVDRLGDEAHEGMDIVLPECGNDRLTKLQCDAILRLANGALPEQITCNGVTFDSRRNRFLVHDREVYLPQKKHMLLELLFLERGRVVTKEMIFNHLYGWDETPHIRTLDVFVCQIRKALREAGLTEDCIQTVRGQGYRICERLQSDHLLAA